MEIPHAMLRAALEGDTDAQGILADYLRDQGCADFIADECYFYKIIHVVSRSASNYARGYGSGDGTAWGIGGGIGSKHGVGAGRVPDYNSVEAFCRLFGGQ